ncbi:unnamed protein product [Amoebophrya sp. A25]|nr:unnamed protein product [Amoebophrya sp. A25]|eukprot:GSA25T00021823001.1
MPVDMSLNEDHHEEPVSLTAEELSYLEESEFAQDTETFEAIRQSCAALERRVSKRLSQRQIEVNIQKRPLSSQPQPGGGLLGSSAVSGNSENTTSEEASSPFTAEAPLANRPSYVIKAASNKSQRRISRDFYADITENSSTAGVTSALISSEDSSLLSDGINKEVDLTKSPELGRIIRASKRSSSAAAYALTTETARVSKLGKSTHSLFQSGITKAQLVQLQRLTEASDEDDKERQERDIDLSGRETHQHITRASSSAQGQEQSSKKKGKKHDSSARNQEVEDQEFPTFFRKTRQVVKLDTPSTVVDSTAATSNDNTNEQEEAAALGSEFFTEVIAAENIRERRNRRTSTPPKSTKSLSLEQQFRLAVGTNPEKAALPSPWKRTSRESLVAAYNSNNSEDSSTTVSCAHPTAKTAQKLRVEGSAKMPGEGVYSEHEFKALEATTIQGLKDLLAAQPPDIQGEGLLDIWDELWTKELQSVVVNTVDGPSDDVTNPVYPYEKIRAVVKDGGNWKWPRMWQRFDELERRGPAYRPKEVLNCGKPNKNPRIVKQKVLVVGGGPVGMRCAIELAMGGHKVVLCEKRREDKGKGSLGFTNRINRPHNWPFLKHDLEKLNGKELLSQKACYPVFTEPHTSSIGIDELQCLLLKNLLLLGVEFRLGVGFKDAKCVAGNATTAPKWGVTLTYDAAAKAKFGKDSDEVQETFGVILGCDGPRSTVREKLQTHFGGVEKRKFMDAVGIVANIEKLPRKRALELGFKQDLEDMNRSKMLFKPFFKKIMDEADIDLDVVIYYRAASHNYCIFAPTRKNLIKHGVSGKIYHHTEARQAAAGAGSEKEKLRDYVKKILKAAEIPFDENAGSNGGFVKAPNDVMAFDFAECWNCKKSFAVNLPDPSKDQSGTNWTPPVGLCGDSLLEPFWPMGLGLKRGWQAIMDTCYAVDNIYNQELFTGAVPGKPTPSKELNPAKTQTNWLPWKVHQAQFIEQLSQNFEFCSRLCITEEAGKGEFNEKNAVNLQLKKINKDAPKASYLIEVDPWTRYAPLKQKKEEAFKYAPSDKRPTEDKVLEYQWKFENNWPTDCTPKVVKHPLSVDGRKIEVDVDEDDANDNNTFSPPARRLSGEQMTQITQKAGETTRRLSDKIVAQKIDDVVAPGSGQKKAAAGAFGVFMQRAGETYTQKAIQKPDLQTAASDHYSTAVTSSNLVGDKLEALKMVRKLKAEALAKVQEYETMERLLLAGNRISDAAAHIGGARASMAMAEQMDAEYGPGGGDRFSGASEYEEPMDAHALLMQNLTQDMHDVFTYPGNKIS